MIMKWFSNSKKNITRGFDKFKYEVPMYKRKGLNCTSINDVYKMFIDNLKSSLSV